MDTLAVGDSSLAYEVRGSGEPLLIIHGAILCGAFEGIARALSSSNKLITYHRRGFGGSSAARKDGTIADQAADAVALLDHLGEGAAQVVGHSYGGVVALQLAIDHPERVHTLALLEPPLLTVPGAADFASGVAAVADLYQSGDAEGALVAFLTAVGGGDPVPRISETLPSGWHEQALTDLSVLFEADLPSISAWQFGEAEARSINQPALAVLGTESTPLFAESCELLKKWLPNAEPFVLDRAGHLLQIDNPDGMAKGLLAFLQRHPMRS